MNIEASSIHASPVSQPDVPLVPAPPLDISHHGGPGSRPAVKINMAIPPTPRIHPGSRFKFKLTRNPIQQFDGRTPASWPGRPPGRPGAAAARRGFQPERGRDIA